MASHGKGLAATTATLTRRLLALIVSLLLGPGSVMLADDTTGKGHITRGVGTEPRRAGGLPRSITLV